MMIVESREDARNVAGKKSSTLPRATVETVGRVTLTENYPEALLGGPTMGDLGLGSHVGRTLVGPRK